MSWAPAFKITSVLGDRGQKGDHAYKQGHCGRGIREVGRGPLEGLGNMSTEEKTDLGKR